MPASNLIQLFDFEGNLERGFRDWLAVQQIDARIGGAPETLGDDYIGAVVEIGATTEHAYDIGGGKLEYDQYAFTLNVEIRTRRHGDVQSETVGVNQRHRELVALVRTWLAVSQAKPDGNLNAHLPYNEIQFLRPSGTNYAAIEPDYDETTLSFTGQFSIKTDAWPA